MNGRCDLCKNWFKDDQLKVKPADIGVLMVCENCSPNLKSKEASP